MNELLQKHGCANVFSVPEGLKELMSDITREVLRIQPKRIHDFIANYLSALLITREHGIMAVKILEDLCDCRPSVSENLLQIGLERADADALAEIIKNEIEMSAEPVEGKEKLKEYLLLKKILAKVKMGEEMTADVCQIARNAYKDYWYRKNLLKQGLKTQEEEPWEIAARNTLNLYKRTKPSITELNQATQKIQAAYRGYHVRRNVLQHLHPKKDKRQGRKVDLSGPPLDVAASREADLGPLINIRSAVQEDNVAEMFDTERTTNLGLGYDPMKTITHVESDEDFLKSQRKAEKPAPSRVSRVKMADSVTSKSIKGSHFADETPHVDHSALMAAEKEAKSGGGQSASKTSKSITLPPADKSTKSGTGQSTTEKSTKSTTGQSYVPSGNRISFSEVPPEVIEASVDIGDESLEIPEDIRADTSGDSTGLGSTDVTDAEDEEEEE